MCRRTPRRPTAMEEAAITTGPMRNRTAMEKAATDFPHAMSLGWSAINSPAIRIVLRSVLIDNASRCNEDLRYEIMCCLSYQG